MHEVNYGMLTSFARTALRAGVVVCSLVMLSAGAEAQTRRQPNTETLTCKQTQALVQQYGAINLKTGEVRFDRYVNGRKYCLVGQSLRTTFVTTKHGVRCPVQICIDESMKRD
ncbi:hypothetical protein FMN50_24630 [Rhodobacterales bacterium]|nr:hypothetical protein FMN50_24630 [Rhodobacterales bacterium]